MDSLRIGGGQGFWGDSPDAAIHMVRHGNIDYLACDYLAELTLSIMMRQKLKHPEAGYARDFLKIIDAVGAEAFENGIKLITNAGGMNIDGLVKAVEASVRAQSLSGKGYKIGWVTGDDIMDRIEGMYKDGVTFDNLDGKGSFADIKDSIVNANVYYGREPIMECLDMGADVTIMGRSTDSAMFLAPIAHELNISPEDWDGLARGIMVGHMLECGGQGAGGNFDYGWREVPRMDELGFPIAQISKDELYVTKAPDCGGTISEQSVKEQFLYEVHDPANYVTPDVVADISRATIKAHGEDTVKIEGIKGHTAPDTLKLSMGYHAGYKVAAMLSFAWPDAYEKAQYAADILKKKMKRKGLVYEEMRVDYIGLNALHLDTADMSKAADLNECVMRIAIRTRDKEEAMKIVPEVAPLQLNGPPGASFFGGRAAVTEVIGLWPTLIPRDCVKLTPHIMEVK